MTTFDLAEVRSFVADLDDRMVGCQNNEGVVCATLDAALRCHAGLCCEFTDNAKRWAREVFAGRLTFDPHVEKLWLSEGAKLYSRALELFSLSRQKEVPCYMLEGQSILMPALWSLYRLLRGWVTPKISVGPAARQSQHANPSFVEDARKRIAELPPLPEGWQPSYPQQRSTFKMLRSR